MFDQDLTQLLRDWPHEPGRINARRITGSDGRPKLQIRLDLGVLHMELQGRPDGAQPHGFESLLDWHEDRLKRYNEQNGTDAGFVLTEDDCRALREEAVQYYHRYVGLFSLTLFPDVIRDTTRNIRLFDLCRDYAASEVDRQVLEQFRPQVIMMRGRSEAEMAIAAGDPKRALAALDGALRELRAIFDEAGRGESFDHANETQLLRGMRDALIPRLPASQRVELEERLRAAIDAENYELAAILRDELRLLKD